MVPLFFPAFHRWKQKDKSFTRFFQKIAVSKGSAFGRPSQRAKYPRRARREIPNRPKRHPQMAQSPAKGHGPRRRPCGGGRRGPSVLYRVSSTGTPGQIRTKRPLSTTRYGVGTAALGLTPWGLRPLRRALGDAGEFRPLRRAGVSLAAASGSFAPCAARPGLCPWTPRFFEKNRVKLLYFFLFAMYAQYAPNS